MKNIKQMRKHWAAIMFRGILAVLFGIFAIFWPNLGLTLLVLIFGAYALVDGFFALFAGFGYKSMGLILEGILGIIAGIFVFFATPQAIVVFLLLVSIWSIITGVFEIMAGLHIRKHVVNEIFLIFAGFCSIIFGLLLFVQPVFFATVFAFVIGVYALVFGFFMIGLAFTLRNHK